MKQETKDTVKNIALTVMPVALGAIGVVYAPGGATGHVLTAWSFLMGTFAGFMLAGLTKASK